MPLAFRTFTAVLLLLGLTHGAQAQQLFPTPEAAVEALVAALGTDKADADALAQLLGSDWRDYIPTEGIEREDVEAFLAHYREKHLIQTAESGRAHLVVGSDAPWTLPLPIVQGQQGWAFDAKAGSEEIRVRRIGRNELTTLKAVRAYHDAQMDYAEVDRDADGVLEYAQHFISSDGQYDGLYWPEQDGIESSPLGPLFGDEQPAEEWHGYHYRILTSQGPSAPGGAYDYRIGDDMSRGFAVIAWPARYDDSGVMSFMISHDGLVFEKDLGSDSSKLAAALPSFDPDSSWEEVTEPEQP